MFPFYVKQRLCSTEILFPSYDFFQGNGSGGFLTEVVQGNALRCEDLYWTELIQEVLRSEDLYWSEWMQNK